jgi:hypothetical protein
MAMARRWAARAVDRDTTLFMIANLHNGEHRMNKLLKSRYRISHVGVLALLSAGLAGCQADDPQTTADRSQELAGRDADAQCVEFEGLKHCSLGGAAVSLGKDGELEVTRMADPRRDGVSIQLPDVSNFVPEGRVEASGDSLSLTASAFHAGTIVGRMTLQQSEDRYVVSAAFTGSGEASPYQVNLYYRNQRVGTIGDLFSGDRLTLWPWWPCWPCWPPPPPPFRNMQFGPNAGACVWDQSFGGADVLAELRDGSTVVVDRIELEEVIPRGGSYPYMSFNRLDYTSDGGRIVLVGERIE